MTQRAVPCGSDDGPGPPQPSRGPSLWVALEHQLADAASIWAEHDPIEQDVNVLASPWHTDADPGRPIEVVTDMSRSRKLGVLDRRATGDSFFELFSRLRDARIIPSCLARWRALEATAFMATEFHGSFRPFFHADATQAERDKAQKLLVRHFATIAAQLGDSRFLVGDRMTIADPYLVVMLMWAGLHKIEVPERLNDYLAEMKKVPSVAKALAEEGLA